MLSKLWIFFATGWWKQGKLILMLNQQAAMQTQISTIGLKKRPDVQFGCQQQDKTRVNFWSIVSFTFLCLVTDWLSKTLFCQRSNMSSSDTFPQTNSMIPRQRLLWYLASVFLSRYKNGCQLATVTDMFCMACNSEHEPVKGSLSCRPHSKLCPTLFQAQFRKL